MRVYLAVLPLLLVAAAPPPGDPRIGLLVKQLGADSYTERDTANQALDKIGAPALTRLRQTQWSSPDLEIRRRAKRLVDTIESRIYGERRVFDGEAGSVNGIAFSPDGRRAAAATSRGVRLWDVATGKLLASNDDHRDRVMAVAFSPDGQLLASGSEDKTVRLWDANLKELRVLTGHKDAVRAVTFTPDGNRLLSAGLDGLLQAWDVATGSPGLKVNWPKSKVMTLLLRPDAERVLIAYQSQNAITSWTLGRELADTLLSGHTKPVMSLSLSRDGARALSGSLDMTLRLWEMNPLHCRHTLKGHTAEVCAVAMSPNGKWAVSGGHDKVLRLWDLENGQHLREFRGHNGVIWCVAFSPDGKHALSGSHDGTMRLWAVGY